MHHHKIIIGAVIAGIVAVLGLLYAIFWYKPEIVLPPPTQKEMYFAMVATDFDAPRYCGLISANTMGSTGPWSPAGFQISYLRSDCYHELAIKSNDPALCSNVVPMMSSGGLLPLDGSKINKEYCLKDVQAGGGIGDYDIYGAELENFLHKLGYTDADMTPKDGGRPDPVEFYFGMKSGEDPSVRADFLRRFDTYIGSNS